MASGVYMINVLENGRLTPDKKTNDLHHISCISIIPMGLTILNHLPFIRIVSTPSASGFSGIEFIFSLRSK